MKIRLKKKINKKEQNENNGGIDTGKVQRKKSQFLLVERFAWMHDFPSVWTLVPEALSLHTWWGGQCLSHSEPF